MRRFKLVHFALLLVVVLVASVAIRTKAASNLQVSQFGAAGYTVSGTADTNDANDLDYVCVVCRNTDGTLNDVDILSFAFGSTILGNGGCNNQVPPRIAMPPYSVAVFDVPGPFVGTLDSPAGAAYCESFVEKEPVESASAPTCIDSMPIPVWAVGGTFISDAVVHWGPSADKTTEHVITAGNSARVIGVDESGTYAKIIWVCDMLWVEASTLGPDYSTPWNGAPLPTVVVD